MQVAAGNEAHASRLRRVLIYREPCLHVGSAKVAVSRFGLAEARVLMPRKVAQYAGHLPVDLINDLLQVGANEWMQDLRYAAV